MAHMLTTIDNPFSPFTEFKDWYNFDLSHNYNSVELLDRIAKTSEELSDSENERIIENAIDEILFYDPLGIRIKVSETDKIKPISIETINTKT